MLRLRPYKPCDAKTIAGWIKDEISFRKWCSDRFENFPITAEDINRKYMDYNGDCVEEDNFYPMTAFDETGIVGVFDNNPSAYYCYQAAGFQDVQMDKEIICSILGEQWKITELALTSDRNTQ